MDKLPSEIIREIFLQDVLASRNSVSFESIRAPLYLSHVCRRWRDISLAFGELWAFLTIRYGKASNVDVLHTWLERTDGGPINFSVTCWVEDDEDAERHQTAEQIVLALLSQQHRWEEVRFTWGFIASSKLTEIRMNGMTKLRSLILDLDIRGERGELISPRIDIARSPDIESIGLSGGTYFVDCGNAILLALTTINLDFSGQGYESQVVNICTELLKAAPNCIATYAEVWEEDSPVYCAPNPEVASRERIVHNIETLHIICAYEGPSTLLSRLTLPALKDLTFHDPDIYNPGGVVLACIERSLPPLVCLDLRGNSSDEQYVIPALRLLPALVHLELRYPIFSERLFKELTCYGDANATSTTCPALEMVYLGSPFRVTDESKCATAFCTMVESRWKYLKKFKKVEIDKVRGKVDASAIRHYEEEVKHFLYSAADDAHIGISGDDNDRKFKYHDY